jgi:hypothetical protein
MAMRIRLALAVALAVMALAWGVADGVPPVATAQGTGSISGVAIDDENGNGVIDAGEPALAGWEIAITPTMTGATAQVAGDGSYVFEGLSPGTYTVSLVGVVGGTGPPPPWIPTLPGPDLAYEITLAEGERVDNVDFAVQLLDEAAVFYATIMVDAAPAPEGTLVRALIGDTVCDEYTLGLGASSGRRGPFVVLTGMQPNTIPLVVPSANEKEGCGSEGATITFTIDNRPANETKAWYSGDQPGMTLTAGPPYAQYWGTVSVGGEYVHGSTVKAYVADTLCGEAEGLMGTYAVIVPPAELKPDCGEEGAVVRFMIGEGEADQIAQWATGHHELNLTAAAAVPPPTSTPPASPTASPSPTTTLSPTVSVSPSAAAPPEKIPDVGGGGTASSDGDRSWWLIALAAAALMVALSGGAFLVWAGRRGRKAT